MEPRTARYFLGANSARGFSSLYDSFQDPAGGEVLHVIKGSPGCGKSTLMRRFGAAAEAAGLPVEYIHCSGDPDSLDGVRLPTRGLAYVDGTAPHVIEARYPGAAGVYLDLSRFLDQEALRPLLPELSALQRRYKALYDLAYRQLAAAAALLPRNHPALQDPEAAEQARRRASSLARRALPPLEPQGGTVHRFLSAVSCQGYVTLKETLESYGRRCILENDLGLGRVYLEALAAAAQTRGYQTVLCHDPLEPEKPEALLLPEADLALLAVDRTLSGDPIAARHVRLDALADAELLRRERRTLKESRRQAAQMFAAAVETLARAKALHDELEALYRPHVDFTGVEAATEEQVSLVRDLS